MDTDLETRLASKLSSNRVDGPIITENVDGLQIVPPASGKVIWVMGRRDLHSAGSEVHVNKLRITDDGDEAPIQGVSDMVTMELGVPAERKSNRGPLRQPHCQLQGVEMLLRAMS